VKYSLYIKPSAKKELFDLPVKVLKKVDEAIISLKANPRPIGCKKLKPFDLFRIRVGSYRVVYQIDDKRRKVVIIGIGHRREIYRK